MSTTSFIAEPRLTVPLATAGCSGYAPHPPQTSGARRPWKPWQRVLFRVAFPFFVLMSIPTDFGWYKNLLTIDWLHGHYRDVYDIARFSPTLFLRGGAEDGTPALLGYDKWFIALGIALLAGLVWTLLERKREEYDVLYYWLRVIVRFRAGIGIIGFGFTKVFPTQMPYPSIGLLNSDFGDMTAQKIFWLQIGIVPWYQVFTGVVETLAGVMLFFRRTTFLGAALLLGALGDIVFVNFAYDGGVHVYSSYFVLLAAFLMIQDVPNLYNLLIRERYTVPQHYYPTFRATWLRFTRLGLKVTTIGIFLVYLTYLEYLNFTYDPYKQPAQKGIAELRGLYNVSEFRLNGQVLPYSPLDSVRWQQVTFEKWTSFTYKVNRAHKLDLSNGGGSPMRDINRTFETTGLAGGQRVFYYDADPQTLTLYLQSKVRTGKDQRGRRQLGQPTEKATAQVRGSSIPAGHSNGYGGDYGGSYVGGKETEQQAKYQASLANWISPDALVRIGDETRKIDARALSTRRERGIKAEQKPEKRDRMTLTYTTADGGKHIVLRGLNERKDSLYVVLDRVDRKYTLSESTLSAGRY
ncbi:hypothetical protein [Hymenobacter volaticus]|uniref:DoxX family protein n=1 Tax=Hymenobacter volaticus TaxID=2932254 RepID=A0ABY4GFH8_9BACT|nr:hypothetical protein [Hymenobacter volaticus]UOQ69675.1 hypothetical protein MUN86_29060 [Hymenobacter volaticus]